ncbi:MAG: hypothetical protein GWN00_25465, partial [Aliifodinibius sp.]|nr:hypothetical protein [Fodinibius sp.]NIY28027.1 hypothetical protein [Fodinibius sp.]
MRAHAAWKKLCAYLECDGRVGQDELVLVLESFEYFRTSGNGEVLNFMREIACNYKPEYDGKSLSNYIIQRLITYDRTELLRIAAHPELGEHALAAHDVDYSTDRVNCLRWLGDYHKSAIYDLQIGVSRILDALCKLQFCDTEVRRTVEPLLQDIKKESVLLGNWQGMFLGADILIS